MSESPNPKNNTAAYLLCSAHLSAMQAIERTKKHIKEHQERLVRLQAHLVQCESEANDIARALAEAGVAIPDPSCQEPLGNGLAIHGIS